MWHGILGHDDVVERFRRTVERGRLASTYLFVGPPGVGKRRFALQLAHALLCGKAEDASLDPCGQCDSCRLLAAGSHPDLDVVCLPPDKAELPIAVFIGAKEHRHQEGLCHRISLKPFFGRRRVAIIDDADHFNEESANCLLKTLEEPPPHSLLILIGTTPRKQWPTVLSRAQLVHFRPLPPPILQQILVDRQLVGDPHEAARVAAASDGSLARAAELADPELWGFRENLLERVARPSCDAVETAKWVVDFVQAAGTEPARRRERLRVVIGFALDFYRTLLREADDKSPWEAPLEACLDALEQVDRNANLALVVSRWLGILADPRGSRPGSIPVRRG